MTLIRRILLTLLMCTAVSAAERAGDGYVLWLHSYHQADWSEAILRGIRAGLAPGTPLRTEYMDLKRRSDAPYLAALTELLRLKHAGRPVLAVVASDDDAARFAVRHRQDIFGGAPVSWCGVNRYEPDLLADGGATGVIEEIDAEGTLDLAFRLRPDAQAIHIICDDTSTSMDNLAALRSTLARLHPQRRVELVRDLPLAHLAQHLAALPPGDVAFFISFWRDGDGKPVEPGQIEPALRGSACPVMGRAEWMIGRGQLGGLCVSGETHGRSAATIAVRLLAGEAASGIPVTTAANAWIFDATELARHGIAESELPEGAMVRFRPRSLLREHPWQVAGVVAAMAALAGLSAALGAAVLRRRRAELALIAERSALSAVLDQSMHFMGILDIEGRVMLVNQSSLDLVGPAGAPQVGSYFWECAWWTHDQGLSAWLREAVRGVAAGGPPVRRLVTHRSADGRMRSVDFSLKAARLPDGSLRLVPEGRDITEMIEVRDRLGESEARFRQLAEHIDAVFWLIDRRTGRALYISPACRRIWGRDPAELSVGSWAMLDDVHPEDREQAARVLGSGVAAQAELRVTHPGGVQRRVRLRAYPVPDDAARTAGIAEDVTNITRLEGEARQAQRLQVLRQLAGGVAHDFNNALAGILGNAELVLVDPSLQGSTQQRIRAIAATASRAGSVTRQLLAFARADTPERRSFDLVHVVGDAVTLARPSLRQGVELRWEPPVAGVAAYGDPGLVQNAVLNLLLNARDAVQGRERPGQVEVTCTVRRVGPGDPLLAAWRMAPGDYAAVTVRDDGPGIDPAVRDRIFEPFFTTKGPGAGSGLGLAAVHGTASSHGGAVEVASEPGCGAVFTLLLPPPAPPEGEARRAGAVVLVADDEPVVREVTAQLLTAMGHRPIMVGDGEEAVERVRAGGIDIVVLDMVMPRMDGREALRRIRSSHPRLPVLLLTGWSEAGADDLLRAGATAVLGKPLAVGALAREIAEALGG